MLDLRIDNGLIVDGTGAEPKAGSIGIRDGRIVALGEIGNGARATIDATGLMVAPGFIDPHTHYDAQIWWDPALTPSSCHGVTTVIGGNCGFTLAPVRGDSDSDYLRHMMVKVEGMPLPALEKGVPWSWRGFGEYLDQLAGRVALNVGFLVGHCALRRAVMGEGAVGQMARPREVRAMVSLLHEALAAGGLGFSSSQAFTHADGNGEPVPSRFAAPDEMLALARATGSHPGTTLELIVDGCLTQFSDTEVNLMVAMSRAARRPLNWNVLGISAANRGRHEHQLAAGSRAQAQGARIVALTMPILGGLKMSFLEHCALNSLPGWGAVLGLPVPERLEALRNPETRRQLRASAESVTGALASLIRWGAYEIGDTFAPENQGLTGRTVAEIARERGRDPFDTLLDIVVADDLRTGLWPQPADDDEESWRLRLQVWRDPRAMLGGSDAGAHLDRMCGARYPTAFLAQSVRERGLLSWQEAIYLMTDVPARFFGLKGRGRVAEGYFADLVLFDPTSVGSAPIRSRNDLPGGAERLYAEAVGVKYVLVNGVAVVEDGRLTGAMPGTVLRSGRDTRTVKP
ncbi:MAG: amidohydrolase family protein [Candidatus Binatia bacterium]|nr:amidohydrolase family protein [Candidatus Binatia bacterium]